MARTVADFSIQVTIVLITGGGSGKLQVRTSNVQEVKRRRSTVDIGLALARRCHERGARVGDVKLVPGAEAFVNQAPANEVAFQHCDVTSWNLLHDLISNSVE
jgi:NAD(P)-dependent dehydrogenase (short-subunit alcohol dehydrogenase family)